MQTNIHHPTDSSLLVDGVRVLSRIVKQAKGLIKDRVSHVEQLCRSRLRSARQAAHALHQQLRRKGEAKEAEQKEGYQKLIKTAEQMIQQTRQVVSAIGEQTHGKARKLQDLAKEVLPRVEQVIKQTRTRVLEGLIGRIFREGHQPL